MEPSLDNIAEYTSLKTRTLIYCEKVYRKIALVTKPEKIKLQVEEARLECPWVLCQRGHPPSHTGSNAQSQVGLKILLPRNIKTVKFLYVHCTEINFHNMLFRFVKIKIT